MDKPISPLKAIKKRCLDCSAGQINEVRNCPRESCPLYPFRSGKNPFIHRSKREYSEEEILVLRERMKEVRKIKEDKKNIEKSLDK